MRLRRLGDRPAPLARMEMVRIHDVKQQRRAMMSQGEDPTPGWATGLRQLYQVVAEEPVPADFSDLLARIEGKPAASGRRI